MDSDWPKIWRENFGAKNHFNKKLESSEEDIGEEIVYIREKPSEVTFAEGSHVDKYFTEDQELIPTIHPHPVAPVATTVASTVSGHHLPTHSFISHNLAARKKKKVVKKKKRTTAPKRRSLKARLAAELKAEKKTLERRIKEILRDLKSINAR